jgi:hypothetical protein
MRRGNGTQSYSLQESHPDGIWLKSSIAQATRMARWLVASAAMVAYLGASPIVGDALIGPHERAYPALRRGSLLPGVGYVVVLSGFQGSATLSC